MSETITETPAIPDGSAPGPVAGTTPPEAGSSPVAPAPAADSPAPTPSSDAAPTPPPSLLSEAKSTEAAPTEPVAATEPDKPAEPTPAPELPLPTYETFTIPEGVTLNEEQLGEFQKLLGATENRLATTPAEAHAAMQELGQKALDLYLKDIQETQQRAVRYQHEVWQRTREQWVSEFRDDPDIGGARQDATLARAGAMLELYGQRVGAEAEARLRQAMNTTGAGDHPEMLRFMNWAADFAIEKPRMIAAQRPAPQPLSRAQRLYARSIPTNGAA